MSLTSIMHIAKSGLQVNQETMRYISTNVTNVNSPDYVRKVVHQEALSVGGQSAGVRISSVQRSVDQYLEADRLRTISEYNRYKEFVDVSGEMQALFGKPNENESLNGYLDQLTAGFSQLSVEPESLVRRYQTLQDLDAFGEELERVADRLQFIRSNVEGRIQDEVGKANSILQNLDRLNPEISRELGLGRDASALLEERSALLQDLSEVMDIRTYEKSNGFLVVTSGTGQMLLEDTLYQLQYTSTPLTSTSSTFNPIQVFRVNEANGQFENPADLEPSIDGGTLKGLLEMRDKEIPNVAEQLGQLGMVVSDALNKVSNENSALPAPNRMLGRETGLIPSDRLNFTGEMVVLVTNADRETQESIRVNFDLGTIDNGSGTPTQFAPRGMGSIEEFLEAFNQESDMATLSFDPGQGKMQIISDNQDNGVIIAQDALERSTVSYTMDLATDLAAGGYGTSAPNTAFEVTIGDDTVVSVTGLHVDTGYPGQQSPRATLADQLNADANFRNAGLTAKWVTDSSGSQLVVEHVSNEELTNVSLTNLGTGYTRSPILDESTANPSIRGNRGAAVAFNDMTDTEIAANSGSIDFNLDVEGTTVSITGITAANRAEVVDALNWDANFRAANLTAYYHNNAIYVEHKGDPILANATLTGSTSVTNVAASNETQSNGAIQSEGRGFSHFFGMNDLVGTDTLPFRETGILATEPHRFKGSTLTFSLGATETAADAAVAAATLNLTVGTTALAVGVTPSPATRDGLVTALNGNAAFAAEGLVASFDGTDLIIESSRAADVTGVSLTMGGAIPLDSQVKHGGTGGAVVMEVRGPSNELPILLALNFSETAYNFAGNFPDHAHVITREVNLAGAGYTDMQSVVDALNHTITGLGSYMTFSLDADGQLSYKSAGGVYEDYDLMVLDDSTVRGNGSKSMTDLFGIGRSHTMNGAFGLDIKSSVMSDPNQLSLSTVESYMTQAQGTTLGSTSYLAINPGDTAGVTAYEAITRTSLTFEAAGDLSTTTLNMSSYATTIIQQTSLNAAQAEQLGDQRESVLNELQRRWESVSAVNLDEELANMITFQNSYGASARLLTTVSEMFDTLLQL